MQFTLNISEAQATSLFLSLGLKVEERPILESIGHGGQMTNKPKLHVRCPTSGKWVELEEATGAVINRRKQQLFLQDVSKFDVFLTLGELSANINRNSDLLDFTY